MRPAWNHSQAERDEQNVAFARGLSMSEKIGLRGDLKRTQRTLHSVYLRCFVPAASDQQVVDHWGRLTFEPALYLNVRDHRRGLGLDVLPLPGSDDIRIDALIRRLLSLESRQVFCEQYYEPTA
jgi:hypothetical protein